jgi:hypothetical protein
MIAVRIPRFSDDSTEFTIMVSHHGEDYKHIVTRPVPRTETGEVDRVEVDRLAWEEYVLIENSKDEVWPERTPAPFERPLAETVFFSPPREQEPSPESDMSGMPEEKTQAPTEPISPYGPGEPFGPSV